MPMNRVKVTTSGQMTLPASIRRRWGTTVVEVEDAGDHVIVRPGQEDPIGAGRGAFAGRLRESSAEMRARGRREDAAHDGG